MITFKPGEQSVVVVIVVLHEGHVPVTGSIELHPSIIVVVGVAVTTIADRERKSQEMKRLGRSLSELPHKITYSFNAQYLFVAPAGRQARTLAARGSRIRGEEAARSRRREQAVRSREEAAARRLVAVAQAVGAYRVLLEPCYLNLLKEL